MAALNNVIVNTTRLYFMTIMYGRSRPAHNRRLRDIREICNSNNLYSLTEGDVEAAYTALEQLRRDGSRFPICMDIHKRLLTEAYTDEILYVVETAETFDYSSIDRFAFPLMAYLSKQLLDRSPEQNLSQFTGSLTGMLIPNHTRVNLEILLLLYDSMPALFSRFPRSDYEALAGKYGRLIISEPEPEPAPPVRRTPRSAPRVAVKQPPRPAETPARPTETPAPIRPAEAPAKQAVTPRRPAEPRTTFRTRRLARYRARSILIKDDDTFELNSDEYVPRSERRPDSDSDTLVEEPRKSRRGLPRTKRIAVDREYESSAEEIAATLLDRSIADGRNPLVNPPQMVSGSVPSLSQMLAPPPAPVQESAPAPTSVPGIKYCVEPDQIVGAARGRCFMFGEYVAIPVDGAAAIIRFKDVAARATAIEGIDSAEQFGEYYVMETGQLIQVFNIIAPTIDLADVPRIQFTETSDT